MSLFIFALLGTVTITRTTPHCRLQTASLLKPLSACLKRSKVAPHRFAPCHLRISSSPVPLPLFNTGSTLKAQTCWPWPNMAPKWNEFETPSRCVASARQSNLTRSSSLGKTNFWKKPGELFGTVVALNMVLLRFQWTSHRLPARSLTRTLLSPLLRPGRTRRWSGCLLAESSSRPTCRCSLSLGPTSLPSLWHTVMCKWNFCGCAV